MKAPELEIFYGGKLLLSLSAKSKAFDEVQTARIYSHATDIYYLMLKLQTVSALVLNQILTDGQVEDDDLRRLAVVMRKVNALCDLIDPVNDDDNEDEQVQ